MLSRNEVAETRALTPPRIYLVRMGVFLVLAGFLVFILYRPIWAAFLANPGLNGLILGVLLIGIVLAIRQVVRLFREVRWVNDLGRSDDEYMTLEQPVLLAPMAALIGNRASRTGLSVTMTRSLLDSIAARLDENRELVRYLAGLLVFLGLLGTFWGLIDTVGSVGKPEERGRERQPHAAQGRRFFTLPPVAAHRGRALRAALPAEERPRGPLLRHGAVFLGLALRACR